MADCYWELDAEFRFTVVSRPRDGLRAHAFPQVGRMAWELPALNMAEEDWERHRAQLAWHQPFRDFELAGVGVDGHLAWISLSGQPVFDERGEFKGYRGIARDITARKRAEGMRQLEHTVARCLARAGGLRDALRAICEAEGWDAGRCFLVDEASGALALLDGWFARESGIERLLTSSRVLWEAGKPVWSADPAAAGAERGAQFATCALPVTAQGRTLAMLAFSGHTTRQPDAAFFDAGPALGNLFAHFLQRRVSESALRESEARFRSLTQLSSDFFWESDTQHRLSSVVHGPHYPAAAPAYGVQGKAPWELESVFPEAAGWRAHKAMIDARLPFRDFELARESAEGARRYFAVSGEPRHAADGRFLGYRGVGRDVTELATARQRMAALAYSDPLTGLANRVSLAPALERSVERARRHRGKVAGVFVDLDGFKQINDQHGHAAGDAFLVEVSQRLRRGVRASDLVARLGGDEFFVLLEDIKGTAAVEGVVVKLADALRQPYPGLGEASRGISATLGVSIFPDDAADASTLVKHADEAMYRAKQAGKNAYCLYAASGAAV